MHRATQILPPTRALMEVTVVSKLSRAQVRTTPNGREKSVQLFFTESVNSEFQVRKKERKKESKNFFGGSNLIYVTERSRRC